MQYAGPLFGALATFVVWQFFIWPKFFRGVDRTIAWWVDRKYGRIYSLWSVDRSLAEIAEKAIAANKFKIIGVDNQQRVFMVTEEAPRLVAIISREPSMSGGAPDLVVRAAYDPAPSSPEAFASDMLQRRLSA
jgi:hypothetical protein